MADPVLMAIDEDPAALEVIVGELRNRYGDHYEAVGFDSAEAAVDALEQLERDGRQIAILLANVRLPASARMELLVRAKELHPQAKRGLRLPWGDRTAADTTMHSAATGEIDFWAPDPWRTPDEEFHSRIGEVLREWSRNNLPPLELVGLVGERWHERTHEIRDLFNRNRIPYRFYEAGTEAARAVLARTGVPEEPLPVLILFDGRILHDPDNAEVARALGVKTNPEGGVYDLVVLGGGPSGLAASVYATSEGLRTALIEREAMGGQAGTTSLIRNYLGFPRGISGGDLAQRAYEQAWLFGTEFVYANEATDIRAEGGHRVVTLADGTEVVTKALILATGVSYRRIGVPHLGALSGAGVYFGAAVTEASAMKGEKVFVIGGGNSAGQAAVHLAKSAQNVTLLVRGPLLAESMSDYLIKELQGTPNIDIRYRIEAIDGDGRTRLERLTLKHVETGQTEIVPAAAVFILIGAEPRTGWLPDVIERDRWGFVLTGTDLAHDGKPARSWAATRPPMLLETSCPGVFAVGDVRHASIKRVASAVGEGSIAVQFVHDYLRSLV